MTWQLTTDKGMKASWSMPISSSISPNLITLPIFRKWNVDFLVPGKQLALSPLSRGHKTGLIQCRHKKLVCAAAKRHKRHRERHRELFVVIEPGTRREPQFRAQLCNNRPTCGRAPFWTCVPFCTFGVPLYTFLVYCPAQRWNRVQ